MAEPSRTQQRQAFNMETRMALVENDADDCERDYAKIDAKLSKLLWAVWLLIASIIGGVATTLLAAAILGGR